MYLNLNIIPCLKFKILGVMMLKRKAIVFRANSYVLEASKFDTYGKSKKKANTILRIHWKMFTFSILYFWPSRNVFIPRAVSSGNSFRRFGWIKCLQLYSLFWYLKHCIKIQKEEMRILSVRLFSLIFYKLWLVAASNYSFSKE